jgi:hypothetical protein
MIRSISCKPSWREKGLMGSGVCPWHIKIWHSDLHRGKDSFEVLYIQLMALQRATVLHKSWSINHLPSVGRNMLAYLYIACAQPLLTPPSPLSREKHATYLYISCAQPLRTPPPQCTGRRGYRLGQIDRSDCRKKEGVRFTRKRRDLIDSYRGMLYNDYSSKADFHLFLHDISNSYWYTIFTHPSPKPSTDHSVQ